MAGGHMRGFTLLEVIVALAVLAVALGGSITLAHQALRDEQETDRRVLAGWVAGNALHALQLGLIDAMAPAAGREDMGGRAFYWSADVQSTADGHVRRASVSVREGGTQMPVLTSLDGYLRVRP